MNTKTYTTLLQEAKDIRIKVFIKEQGFENEFDDIDPEIFRDPLLMVKWLNRHTQNQS